MTILLTIIHVIVCLILILVILLQAGRGQGLTGPSFASGNVQSLFGTRAGDFLTKATTVSAIFFILTCFGLDFIETQKSRSLLEVKRHPQAPIDIDAIKKALEKMKQEKMPMAGKASDAATAQASAPGKLPAVPTPPASAPAVPPQKASSETSTPKAAPTK